MSKNTSPLKNPTSINKKIRYHLAAILISAYEQRQISAKEIKLFAKELLEKTRSTSSLPDLLKSLEELQRRKMPFLTPILELIKEEIQESQKQQLINKLQTQISSE